MRFFEAYKPEWQHHWLNGLPAAGWHQKTESHTIILTPAQVNAEYASHIHSKCFLLPTSIWRWCLPPPHSGFVPLGLNLIQKANCLKHTMVPITNEPTISTAVRWRLLVLCSLTGKREKFPVYDTFLAYCMLEGTGDSRKDIMNRQRYRKESLLKQPLPLLGIKGSKGKMNEPSLALWKVPELEEERSQPSIINRLENPFSTLFLHL